MANFKITEFNSEIIEKLTEKEIKDFLSEYKKNGNEKSLFLNYIDLKKADKLNDEDELIEKELIKSTEGIFTELNQNLNARLFEFLIKKNKIRNKFIIDLEDEIKLCYELLERKHINIALDKINKIYKKIKEIQPNRNNYHVFMQYINLILEAPGFSRKLDNYKFNEEIIDKEVITWLNNVCISAVNNAAYNKVEKSENIELNLLYYFYFQYHQERDYLNELNAEHTIHNPFDYLKDSTTEKPNKNLDRLLNHLFFFEKLKTCLKLNDVQRLNLLFNELNAEFNVNTDSHYQAYIFVLNELINIRIELNLELKDFKGFLNDDYEIDYSKLLLFTENDIKKIYWRLNINQGIILLLSKKYDKAFKHFESISNPTNLEEEYYYNKDLFLLMSDPFFMQRENEIKLKVDSIIKRLKKKRDKQTDFVKSFIEFYLGNFEERKIREMGPKFLEEKAPTNLFERIIYKWLQTICE